MDKVFMNATSKQCGDAGRRGWRYCGYAGEHGMYFLYQRRSTQASDSITGTDFDQVIEESSAGPQVRQARAGRGVAVDAVGRVLIPPDALRDDDAGLDRFPDHGLRLEAAAVVVDADKLAVSDAAPSRVRGMYFDRRFPGCFAG